MKKFCLCAAIFCLAAACFAENEISDFCQKKIDEFVTLRVELKSEDDLTAVEMIKNIENETMIVLPAVAKDFEQEKQILANLYFMEAYARILTKENRVQLRKNMKKRMNDCLELMQKRSEEQLSKWFYVSTADVTSYYMTRSIAATFYWGFKVKDWHKKALKKDEFMASANACLGNWNFYAPPPIGSNKKARQLYKNGIKGARTPGEKYMVYTYYSQFLYELGEKDECEKYMELAYGLELGTKELDLMRKCNDEGISYLQYMRNSSGIDEEIPESEKEEDD